MLGVQSITAGDVKDEQGGDLRSAVQNLTEEAQKLRGPPPELHYGSAFKVITNMHPSPLTATLPWLAQYGVWQRHAGATPGRLSAQALGKVGSATEFAA